MLQIMAEVSLAMNGTSVGNWSPVYGGSMSGRYAERYVCRADIDIRMQLTRLGLMLGSLVLSWEKTDNDEGGKDVPLLMTRRTEIRMSDYECLNIEEVRRGRCMVFKALAFEL